MPTNQDLVIRIDREKLGRFIADLLGQRRKSQGRISVDLMFISYVQIVSICEAITQRVAQNAADLISFQCRYYFMSGRIITINDYNAFLMFDDAVQDRSLGLKIEFVFLIQFPDAETPEKQEIRLDIFSHEDAIYNIPKNKVRSSPLITFQIESTNVTWSDDMFSLLVNRLRPFSRGDWLSKAHRSSREVIPIIAVIGACTLFLGSIISASFFSGAIKRSKIDNMLNAIPMGDSIDIINKKIDVLISNMRPIDTNYSFQPKTWFFLTISVVFLLLSYVALRRYGVIHIVSTNTYTEELLKSAIYRRNQIIWGVIVAFIIGVIASLVAAHIDALL